MKRANPKYSKFELHSNDEAMLGVPGKLKNVRENQNNHDSAKYCELCKMPWQWEGYQKRGFSSLPDFPTIGLPRENCPSCQKNEKATSKKNKN